MLVFFDRTIKLKEVISVARAVVSIIPPFGKVRQLTDLVIFSDVKSYIPEWDTPDYLNACRKYAAQNKVYLVPSRFVVDNILYLCTTRRSWSSIIKSNPSPPPSATSFCVSMSIFTTRRWSALPA